MKAKIAMSAVAAALMVFGIAAIPDEDRQVRIAIKHSRFIPAEVSVPSGVSVTFEIVNDDPIDHEFIVGTRDVHLRHASGSEAEHRTVPGEVSVPAKSRAGTTYVFDEPGRYRFVCHLPGHEAYGMQGWVTVS